MKALEISEEQTKEWLGEEGKEKVIFQLSFDLLIFSPHILTLVARTKVQRRYEDRSCGRDCMDPTPTRIEWNNKLQQAQVRPSLHILIIQSSSNPDRHLLMFLTVPSNSRNSTRTFPILFPILSNLSRFNSNLRLFD